MTAVRTFERFRANTRQAAISRVWLSAIALLFVAPTALILFAWASWAAIPLALAEPFLAEPFPGTISGATLATWDAQPIAPAVDNVMVEPKRRGIRNAPGPLCVQTATRR